MLNFENSVSQFCPIKVLIGISCRLFFLPFFGLKWRSPLYPGMLQYCTMILQCPRIIVRDAGFEPGTSLPQQSGVLTFPICIVFSCQSIFLSLCDKMDLSVQTCE